MSVLYGSFGTLYNAEIDTVSTSFSVSIKSTSPVLTPVALLVVAGIICVILCILFVLQFSSLLFSLKRLCPLCSLTWPGKQFKAMVIRRNPSPSYFFCVLKRFSDFRSPTPLLKKLLRSLKRPPTSTNHPNQLTQPTLSKMPMVSLSLSVNPCTRVPHLVEVPLSLQFDFAHGRCVLLSCSFAPGFFLFLSPLAAR